MIKAARRLVDKFITEDATFVPGEGIEQCAANLLQDPRYERFSAKTSPGEVKYELKRRQGEGWISAGEHKVMVDDKLTAVKGIKTLSHEAQEALAKTIAARAAQPKKRKVRTRYKNRARTAGTVVPAS